jgi:hypothetical protein
VDIDLAQVVQGRTAARSRPGHPCALQRRSNGDVIGIPVDDSRTRG